MLNCPGPFVILAHDVLRVDGLRDKVHVTDLTLEHGLAGKLARRIHLSNKVLFVFGSS